MQKEFEHIQQYLVGHGVDVGCGTNRISHSVLSVDQQPDVRYAHADVVHDCKDLEIPETKEFDGHTYTFEDDSLDFIFSSHCLEDFDNIPQVFQNWWKKIKPDGLMILLLPDMEGGRYPKVGDPSGNPSHKTDVGRNYIENMLKECDIKHEMIQCDTLPHDQTCTIDFVI
ncbi:MAG: methyltransferase domain-containing protein, partial [Planctomycetota bacterium]